MKNHIVMCQFWDSRISTLKKKEKLWQIKSKKKTRYAAYALQLQLKKQIQFVCKFFVVLQIQIEWVIERKRERARKLQCNFSHSYKCKWKRENGKLNAIEQRNTIALQLWGTLHANVCVVVVHGGHLCDKPMKGEKKNTCNKENFAKRINYNGSKEILTFVVFFVVENFWAVLSDLLLLC